jgi:outer membrane protein OmpA-like peptidoglycan-associated protein
MKRSINYCIIPGILLCLIVYPVFSQSNKEALKSSRAGYEFEQESKLSEALFEYNKAIALDPKYPYPLERIGAMYQRLHNYPRALSFLHRAIALDSNFDDYNFYNLATCYKALQKNDSAVLYYKTFLHRMKPIVAEDSSAMRDANTLITFTEQCIALRAKPKNTQDPVVVKGEINSPYDDFSPTVTSDGKTMYFTSRRPSTNIKKYAETKDFGDDIFYSTLGTAGWSKPLALPPPIDTKDDEGAVSISADGQTVFYSLCRRPDGFGDCDIYYSQLNGAMWSTPKNLGSPFNSPQWDAQPSISPDGTTMYFSSRRYGSTDGSEDIWVAYKNTDGTWGKPVNLGPQINTGGSERSPFIANDGRTLYFSSNGRPGFGGHDLFMTRKRDDGSWSDPVNLGSPINSSGDDEFLTIPARGDKVFYASQRDSLKGSLDIYEAILPLNMRPYPVTLVTGKVFDIKTKKPLGAKIEVTDLAKDQIQAEYNSNSETGEFQIPLPVGVNYGITASAPHYAFFSNNYSVPDSTEYKEIHYQIGLTRIDEEPIASNSTGQKDSNDSNRNNGNNGSNGNNGNNENTASNTNGNNGSNLNGNTNTIDTTVIPLNNIFFDFNKATLRKESITELRHMIKFMHEYPKLKIEISGHTDSIGTDEVNRKLSQERAESVREYLTSHGVHALRVFAKGYGASKPVAPNDSEEGRQRNRRTEFRIISRS